MSSAAANESKSAPPPPPSVDTMMVKVDGVQLAVPKVTPDPVTGKPTPTTMIQACHQARVEVPHYCYHPKLPVAGNCRMCLVEFGTPAMGPDRKPVINPDGTVKIMKSPRPAIACATPITPGMEIYTNTPGVRQMRQGVLEFLLINHPLDCPICDQAGECKLQEYSMEYGQAGSRFVEEKVHKPKQVDLGPRIMLDDERCILCSRCVRFTRDIVGDDALGFVNRGSYNTLTAYPGKPFDNNYTLNTVDICPVGALTSRDFRFQMRVWFLKETKSLCTSCGTGCNIVAGSRENKVYRYEPRQNDGVNSTWMCDEGRLNYKWIGRPDRLSQVQRRENGGALQAASWSQAIAQILAHLKRAEPGSVAILASARMTNEELFLVKKLADHHRAITDIVPRTGQADPLLVVSDKNPNTTGARLLGIADTPPGSGLERMVAGIKKGTIRTLLALGEGPTRMTGDTRILAALDCLVVNDILPDSTTRAAHWVLPGCAHMEKQGSFTNIKGRVQRFWKGVEAPGDAIPETEWLSEVVRQVTGQQVPKTVEGIFNQMAAEVAPFKGMTYAGLGDQGLVAPPEFL